MDFQKNMLETLVESINQTQGNTSTQDISANEGIPVNNATFVSNFEPFDLNKESFRNYRQRFENYLEIKQISNDKRYCSRLLLNSIGAKHFDLICALTAPNKPTDLDYDNLITIVEEYISPKRNDLVALHKFLSIYQRDNESISTFVASLKSEIGDCKLISPCDCKVSIADIFLRAQFIRGLKDNSIREQILQSELTEFKDIVSKAVSLETAKLDSKVIAENTTINPDIDACLCAGRLLSITELIAG